MKKLMSAKEIIEEEIKKDDNFSLNFRVEILRVNWKNIVGEILSKKSEPYALKNEILYIKVENSIWIQQMNFYKSALLAEANRILNGEFIKGINIKFGKIESEIYTKARKIVREEKIEEKNDLDSIYLDNEEIYKIKMVISKIIDTDLKRNLYRIMVKGKKREIYLQQKGYKKCVRCGIYYEGEGKNCFTCNIELQKIKNREIYKYLVENPLSSDEDLLKAINSSTIEDFQRVRLRLKSNIQIRLKMLAKENKIDEFRKYGELFYKLETKISNKELIEKKVNYLLEQFHVKLIGE